MVIIFVIISIFPSRIRFASILLVLQETMKIPTKPLVLSPRLAPYIRQPFSPSSSIPSSSQVINTMRHPAQDRYGVGPDFRTRGGTGHSICLSLSLSRSLRRAKKPQFILSQKRIILEYVYVDYIFDSSIKYLISR